MARPSPASLVLREAFDAFLSLLTPVGFALGELENRRPGWAVALASRALAPDSRIDVCLWCDASTGSGLTLRVDVVGPIEGVTCTRQIDLKVPWADPSAPNPASLAFAGQAFLPHQGPEQLRKAVECLAGGFACSGEALSAAVPELAEEWRRASPLASWARARERGAELWRSRHVRGSFDDRSHPATIVFYGARLVVVAADGERLTFTFDTRDFDRNASVSVSGWITTAAGTRRATTLACGGRTWTFDAAGALLATSGRG